MLLYIVGILAVVAAALAIAIALQPNEFRVTRSASMTAPPEKIFAQVNDFYKWAAWSPWVKLDPNAKMSFDGPPAGAGAITRWDGNRQVGAGSMTILESRPAELVKLRLDFLKPMQGTSIAEFTFKPEGAETVVSWSMHGKNNFVAKAMGLIFNCDKMVGGQFDQGLANLKAVVEAGRE
ncbi:MAG: SRPBCC family protein [Alphaproteobacteria bacterium]